MIERLVVWGGTPSEGLESHRWVHQAFHLNARKLGIPSAHVPNDPDYAHAVTPDCTVIGADIYGSHLPFVEGARYVLHNFGSHPVIEQCEPDHLLRLQVWTHDAFGEQWDTCRAYDRDSRILFQPWGSDLLAEEFLEPVLNPHGREVIFCGAVWAEPSEMGDLGNEAMIYELRRVCSEHRLILRLETQLPQSEMVDLTRGARLAPAFAGGWQVSHGYLPCRLFKTAAYGVLTVTNVPEAHKIFGADLLCGPLPEVMDKALSLSRAEYLERVREQQRIVARWTYRESLEAISRALEEG